MKKSLILIFCCFLAFTVHSQVKVGVKGGLNVSGYILDPTPEGSDLKTLAGFHLGGFLNYTIADNFSIQGELMYSGMGGRITGTGTDALGLIGGGTVDTETRDKFDYLSIPLLAKYHAQSGFTAEAGLVFNFLLSAKTSFGISNDDAEALVIEDFGESVNGADAQFALGVGYELASGLSFNGRYAFSLGNVYDQETVDNLGFDAGLGVFQLSVGLPVFAN